MGPRTPRSPRKVSLQLPPELDDSSPKETALLSIQSLLPRALEKLSKLGPVEGLKLRNVVGRGGTSCVRLLKRTGTKEVYVAKVFNTLQEEQSELLFAELRALMAIDCPCVVGFHGAWERDNNVYVVLEAMWLGSLLDVMCNGEQPLFPQHLGAARCGEGGSQVHTRTVQHSNDNDHDNDNDNDNDIDDEDSERVMLAISFQVLWGINYMHSIGLVHGDIKSSNVLVSTCGSVKLADFGTSTFDPEHGSNIAGTFRYMPPERMDEGKFGPEGDVWAAGMMVAELIAQRVPFASCDTHVEIVQQLLLSDGDAVVEHVLPESAGAPESITNLVKECLVMDPAMRPTAKMLLLSPAFAAQGLHAPEDAQRVLEHWMRGDNNERREPLFCCDGDEHDDDDDDDFDDDDYDDSWVLNEGCNYHSDSLSSGERFRSRSGGMNNSTANLLRSASLLAMPTLKKGCVRSPSCQEGVRESWPGKELKKQGDKTHLLASQALRTLSMSAILPSRGRQSSWSTPDTIYEPSTCSPDKSPLQSLSPKRPAAKEEVPPMPVSPGCRAWLDNEISSPLSPFHRVHSQWNDEDKSSPRSPFHGVHSHWNEESPRSQS